MHSGAEVINDGNAGHEEWRRRLDEYLVRNNPADDPAHDMGHFRRVCRTAQMIGAEEGANPLVVVAAAYLHDLVNVPKNHPDRCRASALSADAAETLLRGMGYPSGLLPAVRHAIEAHSFSAGIEPRTVEAACVQDADRLDSLGAIGIARCFTVSGLLGRALMHEDDPMADARPLDDVTYTLDHFPAKLFRIAETLKTETGRRIGRDRVGFVREFRERMVEEASLGCPSESDGAEAA